MLVILKAILFYSRIIITVILMLIKITIVLLFAIISMPINWLIKVVDPMDFGIKISIKKIEDKTKNYVREKVTNPLYCDPNPAKCEPAKKES